MLKLYDKNWLMVWSQKDIQQREMFEQYITEWLRELLMNINKGFTIHKCEVSQLMPTELIKYEKEDYFTINDELSLRPETTIWSYLYIKELLNPHTNKYKLPLVVYQHWKSFRNEQDKTEANMRLKEFYQLEYQIAFSDTTQQDYYTIIVEWVKILLSKFFDVRVEPSDRLPYYSKITTDIINNKNNMELCSISYRTDYPNIYPIYTGNINVVEIAIWTDRLLYNFLNIPN